MKLEYERIKKLPPLAWIADIKGETANIICGENVECNNRFFVEGAWSGEFQSGNFIESDWFCGTGGICTVDGITFSTPSHVTSGLFSSKLLGEVGGVLVSNSLHLLCVYAGFHLDSQYVKYEADFNTVIYGVEQYKRNIFALNQSNEPVEVNVHYFRTIHISNNGNVVVDQRKKSEPFENFDAYYHRLTGAIELMVANAQDDARRQKYGLVTTISKGYDAPCCAVIAHKYGCNAAVTFNATGKYEEDSGIEIARMLGYQNIIERDADAYLKRSDLAEAEIISSGELGSDMCFITFDDAFRNNMVFLGFRGDLIWARKDDICNDNFTFNDANSHLGASERRLWIGYISVPMPLFGASTWTSIQKISQSLEMSKWSIGDDYDRPIPRRICEEAGLRRDMFGIKKHGAGINLRYDWGGRAKTRLSQTASKSFTKYVQVNRKWHPVQLIRYLWEAKFVYLRRLGIRIKDNSTILEKSQFANATLTRYIFPWASEVVQERYKKILAER